MSAGLGPPVVVYGAAGNCDRREHEIVFLTDGYKALAYGPTEDATVSRKGPVFTVYCGEHEEQGEIRCDGEIRFSIAEAPQVGPGWNASLDQIELLTMHGTQPDIED